MKTGGFFCEVWSATVAKKNKKQDSLRRIEAGRGHFKEDAASSSMRFRVLLLARINVQA